MPSDQDPYQILSLPRTATPDQIRRAYKRACLRYHPDKHPAGAPRTHAEANFKSVSLAYSQLCDRPRFSNPIFEFFTHPPPPPPPEVPPPDRQLDLALSLEELFGGCVKKTTLDNPRAPVLNIAIKPGYRPGDRVRFRNIPQEVGPPADVVFNIVQKPHPSFLVVADDLKLTMRIQLVDALAGAVLIVKALDGSDVKVRIDSVIHPEYVHRVPERGMPKRGCPEQRGDLLLNFHIVFPLRVEAHDRTMVRDLFARLDAHSRSRMRRSSSLFMGAKGGRPGRRASMAIPHLDDAASEEVAADRRGRGATLLRFASIFR